MPAARRPTAGREPTAGGRNRRRRSGLPAVAAICAVAVSGFLSGAAAAAPVETDPRVAIQGVNALCPGFADPVEIYPGWFEVDLALPARWTPSVKQGTGVMQTTFHAEGTDADGSAFTVVGRFDIQGIWTGSYWFFVGGEYGSGSVRITRRDGLVFRGSASFAWQRSFGFHGVVVSAGTCKGTPVAEPSVSQATFRHAAV